MIDKKGIREIIISAFTQLKEEGGDPPTFEINDDTILMGWKKGLDSLELVNLIVDVEERTEERFGIAIILADERATLQKNSPFKTIGTLTDYIFLLLEESEEK